MNPPPTSAAIDALIQTFCQLIDDLCATLMAQHAAPTLWGRLLGLGLFVGGRARPLATLLCETLRGIGEQMREAASAISLGAAPPELSDSKAAMGFSRPERVKAPPYEATTRDTPGDAPASRSARAASPEIPPGSAGAGASPLHICAARAGEKRQHPQVRAGSIPPDGGRTISSRAWGSRPARPANFFRAADASAHRLDHFVASS